MNDQQAGPSEAAKERAAERISDLLDMLGVDPDEQQIEDVHGVDTPMGEDVKTVIASAAVRAAHAEDLGPERSVNEAWCRADERAKVVEEILASLLQFKRDNDMSDWIGAATFIAREFGAQL